MSNLTIGLNVFLGGSGAGIVRRAFGIDGERVILQDDDVAFGPVPPIRNIEEWSAQRRAWFRSLYPDPPPEPNEEWEINEVLFSSDKFAVASHLLVWLGESLSSQLFLAYVTFAWDMLGHGERPIFVVQFAASPGRWPIHGPGEISSASMLSRPLPTSKLSNAEMSEYKRAWHAYCDSDPLAVTRFLSSLNSCPFLARALRELVFRYPDQNSGLGIWDQLLLSNIRDRRGPVANAIGHTFARTDNGLDSAYPEYLHRRLIRASEPHAACPLIALTGDASDIRACTAELTEFGREVLAGRANAIQANGIDEWIGGVHLTPDSVVFRDGERLLVP